MLVEVYVKLVVSTLFIVFTFFTQVSQATLLTYELDVLVIDATPGDEPELGTTGLATLSFDDSDIEFDGSRNVAAGNFDLTLSIFGQVFTSANDELNNARVVLDESTNQLAGIEYEVYDLDFPLFIPSFTYTDIELATIAAFMSISVELPADDDSPYLWNITTLGFENSPPPPSIPEPNAAFLLLLASALLIQIRKKNI